MSDKVYVINRKFFLLAILSIGVVFFIAQRASKHWVVKQDCTYLRQQGYSNIPRSSPYYSPLLDRDNDGRACE